MSPSGHDAPAARCRIGTCGWSYASWSRHGIYPPGLPRAEWLTHHAQRFASVEVGSSAYQLPSAAVIERWRSAVGIDFSFALKVWQAVTHAKRLADCSHELDAFLSVVKGLGPCRGPLLFQLPPTLHHDPTLLADFLVSLEEAAGGLPIRAVLEFRSHDWLTDTVFDLCDRHNVAVCLSDLPRCVSADANDADFVYVRRHGPDGRFRDAYDQQELLADADEVRGWLAAGRDVYVHYNNVVGGQAVHDAERLGELLGLGASRSSPSGA